MRLVPSSPPAQPKAGKPSAPVCLVLLALVALLCGCVKVGPDFVRPDAPIASNWLEAGDERVRNDASVYRAWWEAFSDPVLNRVIDRAYRQNYSLKIAGVRVLEARAQLGIAVGGLYPQSQQAAGSLLFNRTSERSSQAASSQALSRLGAGLSGMQFSYWQDQIMVNAAWEMDFWGKFRRAVESADADLLAATADYDTALVSLTADAANAYIEIRSLQRRLEIARQSIESQKESLEIARARYEAGLTSERDVEQAKTALSIGEAAVPALRLQLRQAENALGVLLALPPGNLGEFIAGPSAIPAPPTHVAVGIPADLLRRRPDVRSAELRAAAQCARIGVAKADLLPAFSLTGSFGFLSTNVGRFGLSDIADARSRTAFFGPSFQWNILDYGRITNAVRVQDARFQELLLAYQNTVLQAQQQVEDSLAGFLRSQERAERLAESVSAAKHSFDLAMIQYRAGSTDFTTVLAAQRDLLAVQDSLAGALGEICGNLVGVYRSIGGGWEVREGEDLVSPEIRQEMARRTDWGGLLAPASYSPPLSETPGSSVRSPDW
jgi:NodT family efflux transporter outer membrane factor (OMF) lipoprotein